VSGKLHTYTSPLTWTGNRGAGTASYQAYARDHVISGAGKSDLPGSSDPAFRGDPFRYNPEELSVASLASCHMLWYLHLCADAGVTVLAYRDAPTSTMVEDGAKGGHFTKVVLRPRVRIASGADAARARAPEVLHRQLGQFSGDLRARNHRQRVVAGRPRPR
jgi:organic hydroperoxide reductase OsmC/OhrA